jgi:protoporphyrinogen oxidase
MTEHTSVICIGAGPAGLTAAFSLRAARMGVTVIEKDPTYIGGISKTVRYCNCSPPSRAERDNVSHAS